MNRSSRLKSTGVQSSLKAMSPVDQQEAQHLMEEFIIKTAKGASPINFVH